jgi:hypothetical protein
MVDVDGAKEGVGGKVSAVCDSAAGLVGRGGGSRRVATGRREFGSFGEVESRAGAGDPRRGNGGGA